MRLVFVLILLSVSLILVAEETVEVKMKTSEGDIMLELYPDKTPITVKNFLKYAENGFYDGLIFHRVIQNFMVQGGGFDKKHKIKDPKYDPIKNEADKGLKNKKGTIAMARTGKVNSATCQFFINLKDNPHLDHKSKTTKGFGYCAFGKVTEGMDVVEKIEKVQTGREPKLGRPNWPLQNVIIKSVEVIDN